MQIISIHIHKIDAKKSIVERIENDAFGKNLTEYVNELIEKMDKDPSGRRYLFQRDNTEVKTNAEVILSNNADTRAADQNAERLLSYEAVAQEKINRLSIEIQKGVLIQIHIQSEVDEKFIICKADHTEFLDEKNFEKSKGLPLKKKIFKAFTCFSKGGVINLDSILVYDTNTSHSAYWWRDFLELSPYYSDELNTERAFNAIDKKILDPIKKDYPEEHTAFRNSTVHFFKTTKSFDIEEFISSAIGEYELPEGSELNIEMLKEKIRRLPSTLPEKQRFDTQFGIVKSIVTARFINKIPLTPQIELHLKEDVPNIDKVVTAFKDGDGRKYIKIRTDLGYARFYKEAE